MSSGIARPFLMVGHSIFTKFYLCIMLVLIAHSFDQLVYALVSYTPHAFTLFLLELVATAMHFSCKQQLLINARMNQHE